MTAATLKQCPACTQVTLGPHCGEHQSVTPCEWTMCTDSKCQAQFDWTSGRGHRMAPERSLVQTRKGAATARARMALVNGDWRDDPRDGVAR